ncbi:hypothetical protein [Williamsia muralis]|uniref:Integral membrane protein n=1 Tax=Williamsia marianensis TaxID=85044 RepID=A0ABU4ES63_WILMA|nr:hypothetical protein [Williamsia muralis]MDV7133581.1 hypothetical protein [Williamsia muralis]
MMATRAGQPLDRAERAELERLRRQVADGRRDQLDGQGGAGSGLPADRRALRWSATILLLIIVAALAISGVLARFARSEVLDTDRYVETVSPLARNAALQNELSTQITAVIMERAKIAEVTREALSALTQNAPNVPPAVVGLAPVLTEQAKSFIDQTVRSLLGSEQFEEFWVQANKQAHEALVKLLTGEARAAIVVDDSGTVSIALEPIVAKVRDRLKDRGFAFADNIPDIDKSFVIFRSPDLVKAQNAVSALDKASTILPWLTLLVAVAAVWAAPRGSRRRAVSLVGVSIALAMVVLAIGLSIGRSMYLDAVPADVLSRGSAEALIDAVLVPLRSMLRALAVVAVVVALVGYLSGSSRSAGAVRGAYSSAVDSLRGRSTRAPHPLETFAARYRIPLRLSIIAVAIAVLVFWDYPSGLVVTATVLVAVLAMVVVELVARPAVVQNAPESGS